jgi:hypothetical protein
MNLDPSLLSSLAWRAFHLDRAKDPEARQALNLFQEAATPQNIIELLGELQQLQDTLAAMGRALADDVSYSGSQGAELVGRAREEARRQRAQMDALRLENRALNERSQEMPEQAMREPDTAEASEAVAAAQAARVAWKLVPAAFVEDALIAVDLLFALRQDLRREDIGPDYPRQRVHSYVSQLEDEGYSWSPSDYRYPAHPLLELEPPRLLDEGVLADAERWREQLWHGLEFVDVREGNNGQRRYVTLFNRNTGDVSRFVPEPVAATSGHVNSRDGGATA